MDGVVILQIIAVRDAHLAVTALPLLLSLTTAPLLLQHHEAMDDADLHSVELHVILTEVMVAVARHMGTLKPWSLLTLCAMVPLMDNLDTVALRQISRHQYSFLLSHKLTKAHSCLPANGCQNGCTGAPPTDPPTGPPPSSASAVSTQEPVLPVPTTSPGGATGPPTTDGTCGAANGNTVCGNWPQGSCCSMYGCEYNKPMTIWRC